MSPQIKTIDLDLYGLLDILPTASLTEIKSAYRKKALTVHPDKNPNNPNAAKSFIQLSEVFAILSDEKAKAAYDQTLKAKEASKARTKLLDAKRRKLKEDLERREQQAKEKSLSQSQTNSREQDLSNKEALQREIDRLKKEGSRRLQEEQEFMREQIRQELASEKTQKTSFTRANVNEKSTLLSSRVQAPQPAGEPSFADFEAMVLANLAKAAAAQSKLAKQ